MALSLITSLSFTDLLMLCRPFPIPKQGLVYLDTFSKVRRVVKCDGKCFFYCVSLLQIVCYFAQQLNTLERSTLWRSFLEQEMPQKTINRNDTNILALGPDVIESSPVRTMSNNIFEKSIPKNEETGAGYAMPDLHDRLVSIGIWIWSMA